MKILKLHFKNINSLKGEHEVDFTRAPFVQNNLFAITGPTGSGKTTLLDVISLALFNQVPRLGKMSTSEVLKKGAILTRNQKEAFAQVTYACAEGKFCSRWEISTARTGNLRDYEMFVSEVATNKTLSLKKSEVPTKNEELIGLNYEQFIKSVVLAQGDFAKFLQVPKKERGALLEKITGTGIYRQLGQLAYKKYTELEKTVNEQKTKISTYEEQLISDEVYLEKQKQAEELRQLKEENQKNVDQLKVAIGEKEKLADLEKNLQRLTAENEENEEKLKNFIKEKGAALKKHQELQGFTEEIQQWKNFSEQVANLHEKENHNQEKLAAIKTKLRQNGEVFRTTFGLDFTEDDFQEELEDYKLKVRELYKDKQSIGTEFQAMAKNLQQELKEFGLQLSKKNPQENLQQLEDLQRQNENKKNSLEQKHAFSENTKINEEQEKIRLQLKELRAAEKLYSEIKQLEKEVTKSKTEKEAKQKQIEGFPERIKELAQEIKMLNLQIEAKENEQKIALLQKKLEDYRKELEAEKPCPLCGSLEHPYAEHLPEKDDKIKTALQKLQNELNIKQKELTQKETKLETTLAQNKSLNKSILENDSEIQKKQKSYQTEFSQNLQDLKLQDFANLEEKYTDKLDALQAYDRLSRQAEQLEKALRNLKSLKLLLQKGKSKLEEIAKFFKGDDFEAEINTTEKDYFNFSQEKKQLKKQQTDLEEEKKEIEKKLQKNTETLEANLKPLGYTSIPQALKNLLPHNLVSSYQKEHEDLKNRQISLHTRINDLKKQQEAAQEKVVGTSLEDLREGLEQETQKQATTDKDLRELHRIITNQLQNMKTINKLKSEIRDQLQINKRWKILKELIGDATGNKFNDYAQDLTLSQLLILANKRLALLTDRYKMDKPIADEDDSLVAIDKHMGGQRRSVKTLSGGETFLLSLALALALSDFASRNVEINSLFIDEGFGTLDPETLDQTLDTLEVLQAKSSKMIGVISHVSSLKERIATQIQLSQNGQGYSSLKVV